MGIFHYLSMNQRGGRAMKVKTPYAIQDELSKMLDFLASFGATENNGVSRLLYSSPWIRAQQALKEVMHSFGFQTHFDDVGNLFGRIEGTVEREQVILTGSHIDSVIEGGKYDGAYGIVASLLAAKELFQKNGKPKKTIEVVSLCEEEGSRFPLSFWGSGSITGKHHFDEIHSLTDDDGIPFKKAMAAAGFGLNNYPNPRRKDIACFLEVHVEQGIILENSRQTLGVVSHIVGQKRFTITLTGQSNHAGTTPMNARKDALATACDLIHHLTNKAKQQSDLVATVGNIQVKPNVVNVVAGEATFTLDVRHHQKETLTTFCSEVFDYFHKTTDEQNIKLNITQWMDDEPVKMDETLMSKMTKMIKKEKIPFRQMVSGAGHDSQVFGTFCPTALLFVPSHQGISHSPKEYTKPEDLATGVNILTSFLYELAYT